MAVVSSDFLTAVLTNFRALFNRDFQAAMGLQGWRDLVIPIDSAGEIETYEWFGTVPQVEDVTHGQVSLNSLPEYNFSITNKEYQVAIEVSRAALERDRLNLISPRVSQLAEEHARHPGQLIFNLVVDNATAYDGSAYFANTRTIGNGANIDNILTGSGTSISQIQTDLAAARAQMRLFQDDQGRPMNLIGNAIMVPPGLEFTMWQALNRNSGDNVNTPAMPVTDGGIFSASGYTVITNPYLTDANDWYLWHIGGPMRRPFILQTEKRPVLESDTDPNTRESILKRNFLYSSYGRYNVGFTDPRFGVKTTNT